jgi:hypothetical protein
VGDVVIERTLETVMAAEEAAMRWVKAIFD